MCDVSHVAAWHGEWCEWGMETQGEMTTIRDTGKTEERAASLFHVRLGYTDVRNNGYMLPGSITIISFIVLYPGIESPATVSRSLSGIIL